LNFLLEEENKDLEESKNNNIENIKEEKSINYQALCIYEIENIENAIKFIKENYA
jgi:hypothetical protein